MSGSIIYGTVFVLVWQSIVVSTHENVLNVPQILLPYAVKDTNPSTYLLKAGKGCFKWTSTKPNVATIAADSGSRDCSTSARVTVNLQSLNEDMAVVLAEEEGTGNMLRCDVFVDAISRIEIATTTQELLLGEAPEIFEVHAYDKQGNSFSSLGSQQFEWKFLPADDTVDPNTVLKLLWFHNSAYDVEQPEIYSLEDQKLRGSLALVEGINTGEAIVSAKLSNPAYNDVPAASVKLTVVDNIMLIPYETAYILVNTSLSYVARQLRRFKHNDIALPSEQYILSIVDADIAELNADSASLRGLRLGTTKVLLVDKNVAEAKRKRQPEAVVNVVEPGNIGFSIKPDDIWTLEIDREYEITIFVEDKEGHKITITDTTLLDADLPAEYFTIIKSSENGTYHHVKALKAGEAILKANLKGVKVAATGEFFSLTTPVTGTQAAQINPPIEIEPQVVVFPWSPETSTSHLYKHTFKASGGSGAYTWSSLDTSIATVPTTKSGGVLAGGRAGSTQVRATDTANPTYVAESTVHVLPPTEMHFVPCQVEAEVGTVLHLPLSVSTMIDGDDSATVFADCRQMPLNISFSEDDVFSLEKDGTEGTIQATDACRNILVRASEVGHTTMFATYEYRSVVMTASLIIVAYPPLVVIDPPEVATVAENSTKLIVAKGGPMPWILDSTGYYETMSAEEDDWISINPVKKEENEKNLHYFDVTCTHLGEQMLRIEVGNHPTEKNTKPQKAFALTRFSCARPASLKLTPVITLPMIDGQRLSLENCLNEHKQIPVQNDRKLRLNLIARDADGRKFDSFSTLPVHWSVSDQSAASFISAETSHEPEVVSYGSGKEYTSAVAFQILDIKDKVTGLTAKAEYQPNLKGAPLICAELGMLLVRPATISPSSVTVFAHPDNKASLDVVGGSGNFVVKNERSELASIDLSSTRTIQVTPLAEGVSTLHVYDACLDAEDPADVTLTLADISSVQLDVPKKVGLGKQITAHCSANDDSGVPLTATIKEKLNLQLKLSTPMLTIKPVPLKDLLTSEVRSSYNLIGRRVGVTTVTCEATKYSGEVVSSSAVDVQIFPALKLNPKHVVLIVGSTFQVSSTGGPQPEARTIFSIANETVARVSNIGLVLASAVGSTEVTARSQAIHPVTGEMITHSEDTVIVDVIDMKGFKIVLQARDIVSNTELNMYAVGYNDDGPFTFATAAMPYLQFHWSTTNPDVALAESLHKNSGTTATTERDFHVALRTLKPGQLTIRLQVELPSVDGKPGSPATVKGISELDVHVFDELEILSTTNGRLLLPPISKFQITTNRDYTSTLTYTLLSPGDSDIFSISADGLITTATSVGMAIVVVTAHEKFGLNQTAVVKVEVQLVASVSLVPLSHVSVFSEHRATLPLGMSAQYRAAMHDSIGRRFDLVSTKLEHRLSRFNVARVSFVKENSTFVVRSRAVGDVVFKVWYAANSQVSDYIRVRVADGVTPAHATVALGGMICLKSNTACLQGGSWSSSSVNIVEVDQSSGWIVGSSVGSAKVVYKDDVVSVYSEVTVVDTVAITLDHENIPMLTSSKVGQTFEFPVRFHTGGDKPMEASPNCPEATVLATSERPFVCKVSWVDAQPDDVVFESVFDVEAGYVAGLPTCLLVVKETLPAVRKLASTMDRSISLTVAVTDAVASKIVSSGTLYARFIPAVHAVTTELTLSNRQRTGAVVVRGVEMALKTCQFLYDTEILESTASISDMNGDDGILSVTLRRSVTTNMDTSVSLRCTEGDSINIPVHVKIIEDEATMSTVCQPSATGASQEDSSRSSWLLIILTIILATIILLILHWIFRTRVRSSPPQSTTTTSNGSVFNIPPASPSFTPVHRTPQSQSSTGLRSPGLTGSRSLLSVSQ